MDSLMQKLKEKVEKLAGERGEKQYTAYVNAFLRVRIRADSKSEAEAVASWLLKHLDENVIVYDMRIEDLLEED